MINFSRGGAGYEAATAALSTHRLGYSLHEDLELYIYTLLVSNLVLVESIVAKHLGKFYYRCHILHGHVAIIMKLSPHYVLTESTISSP